MDKKSLKAKQQDLLKNIHTQAHFLQLFDFLQDTSFFAKDQDGVLLIANKHLLNLYGFSSEDEIIGLTDFDLLPLNLAEKYRKDDQRIMSTQKPLLNIVELFLNDQGIPEWVSTNKLPIISAAGKVMGVMGTIQKNEKFDNPSGYYQDITAAVDHIRNNYQDHLSIKDLADLANLSVRQFERKFKHYFSTTPQKYLIKLRVHAACDLLRKNSDPLSDVALSMGFYDQSSFANHFKKCMGITPLQYRKKY